MPVFSDVGPIPILPPAIARCAQTGNSHRQLRPLTQTGNSVKVATPSRRTASGELRNGSIRSVAQSGS